MSSARARHVSYLFGETSLRIQLLGTSIDTQTSWIPEYLFARTYIIDHLMVTRHTQEADPAVQIIGSYGSMTQNVALELYIFE